MAKILQLPLRLTQGQEFGHAVILLPAARFASTKAGNNVLHGYPVLAVDSDIGRAFEAGGAAYSDRAVGIIQDVFLR